MIGRREDLVPKWMRVGQDVRWWECLVAGTTRGDCGIITHDGPAP